MKNAERTAARVFSVLACGALAMIAVTPAASAEAIVYHGHDSLRTTFVNDLEGLIVCDRERDGNGVTGYGHLWHPSNGEMTLTVEYNVYEVRLCEHNKGCTSWRDS